MTAAFAFALTACGSSHKHHTVTPKPIVAGYLYTTTNGNGNDNGEGTNKIMQLTRYVDGSLGNEVVYDTTVYGDANVSVGGDAHGDFDSQGAIQIIGNYLLAVNAGIHNKISVFKIDRSTGNLFFLENVDSGGRRPVSITYTKKPGQDDQYWVVVGNQWNNPNVQKDGDDLVRYPDADGTPFFFNGDNKIDLSKRIPADDERNIRLFSFDSSDGALTPEGESFLTSYTRKNGGPTTVKFSGDGSKLAVSTWGVAHFATDTPSTDEQYPSRVYVYDFNTTDGTITQNPRYFEQKGLAGTIGIDWAPNSNTTIYASNFNLVNSLTDYGLTVLTDPGAGTDTNPNTDLTLIDHKNTGAADTHDEACWTALSPDGKRLYVSSFGANVITPFSLNSDGSVDQALAFAARGDNTPAGDTKDMYITPDNKFMYVLGAFQTFTLNRFKINDDGTLTYGGQYTYNETKGNVGTAGAHNFLGLAGFDIK